MQLFNKHASFSLNMKQNNNMVDVNVDLFFNNKTFKHKVNSMLSINDVKKLKKWFDKIVVTTDKYDNVSFKNISFSYEKQKLVIRLKNDFLPEWSNHKTHFNLYFPVIEDDLESISDYLQEVINNKSKLDKIPLSEF